MIRILVRFNPRLRASVVSAVNTNSLLIYNQRPLLLMCRRRICDNKPALSIDSIYPPRSWSLHQPQSGISEQHRLSKNKTIVTIQRQANNIPQTILLYTTCSGDPPFCNFCRFVAIKDNAKHAVSSNSNTFKLQSCCPNIIGKSPL